MDRLVVTVFFQVNGGVGLRTFDGQVERLGTALNGALSLGLIGHQVPGCGQKEEAPDHFDNHGAQQRVLQCLEAS